ncbi:hypothetical protein ACP4OV_006409 [Aristida adscensionis]
MEARLFHSHVPGSTPAWPPSYSPPLASFSAPSPFRVPGAPARRVNASLVRLPPSAVAIASLPSTHALRQLLRVACINARATSPVLAPPTHARSHARRPAAPDRSRTLRPIMTQGSDLGAAAAAAPPAAGGAMTAGAILTVAGILLLFVAFAAGIVSLQRCFGAMDRSARRTRGGGGGPAGGGANAALRGLDPEVLRSLPVTVYRRAAKDDPVAAAAAECAVCLAELEDGEEARFLPRCGHGFHAECVDTWLASRSTCPLCRLAVVAKPAGASPAAALALALPPVPPEPASYAAANLPASVLLGLSDQGAVTATTVTTDDNTSTSTGATATGVLVIEIPEPTRTPRDTAAKSPGSARMRSIRRLWSFGRQGATGPGASSSSCRGAGDGEGADVEQVIDQRWR